MTYEEAINSFKNEQVLLTESIKMAIKALEKQIPKKVVLFECDPLKSFQKIRKACPNCNATLHGEKDFCADCGQALDWSE